LHAEELYHFYPSPNIIRAVKLKYEMGEVCRKHERGDKLAQNFSRKIRKENHLEDLEIDRRTI